MSGLPLEARGSHESGGPSGAGVPPQARLAVLSIQTIQAGGALDPGRSWWPRGTRHARWASHPFAALLRLGTGWSRGSNFAGESWGTRRAWKAWLTLESLVALLTRAPLGSSLSSGPRWAWGTWEAFGSWWARLPLLSRGPAVTALSLDARQSWGAHGAWVTRLPWRTRFSLVSRQAPEASLSLKANRAWRTRGASHARWTLFSSLAWQSRRPRQARAPSTTGLSLAVVSPGLLSSGPLPLQEAPGAVVQSWHARDALVSLLSFLQQGHRAGRLALDAVPTDALEEVLLDGERPQFRGEPRLSWQTVVPRHSLQPRHSGGPWRSGNTRRTLRARLPRAAHPKSRSTRHAREDGVASVGAGTLPWLTLLSSRSLLARHPSDSWMAHLSLLPSVARRARDTGTWRPRRPGGSFLPWSSLGTRLSSGAGWAPRSRKALNARQALGSRLPLGPLCSSSWRPWLALCALQSWGPWNSWQTRLARFARPAHAFWALLSFGARPPRQPCHAGQCSLQAGTGSAAVTLFSFRPCGAPHPRFS